MKGCNNSLPFKENNQNLTCKFCFRKIRHKGWLCLVFFFTLNRYIFLFICNFNTTDYFWASVIHLIRKYYVHISWKGRRRRRRRRRSSRRRRKMRRVWVMVLSLTAWSPFFSEGERQGEQQFCNIITIFYIATTSQRGGRREVFVFVCFQRVSSESRECGGEGEETKKEERERERV